MTPAGVLTTLLEFTGTEVANLGSSPEAALVQGSDRTFMEQLLMAVQTTRHDLQDDS